MPSSRAARHVHGAFTANGNNVAVVLELPKKRLQRRRALRLAGGGPGRETVECGQALVQPGFPPGRSTSGPSPRPPCRRPPGSARSISGFTKCSTCGLPAPACSSALVTDSSRRRASPRRPLDPPRNECCRATNACDLRVPQPDPSRAFSPLLGTAQRVRSLCRRHVRVRANSAAGRRRLPRARHQPLRPPRSHLERRAASGLTTARIPETSLESNSSGSPSVFLIVGTRSLCRSTRPTRCPSAAPTTCT